MILSMRWFYSQRNFDIQPHRYMYLTFCSILRNNYFKEQLSVVASKYNLRDTENNRKEVKRQNILDFLQPKTWFYETSLLEVVIVMVKIWSVSFSKSSRLLDFT